MFAYSNIIAQLKSQVKQSVAQIDGKVDGLTSATAPEYPIGLSVFQSKDFYDIGLPSVNGYVITTKPTVDQATQILVDTDNESRTLIRHWLPPTYELSDEFSGGVVDPTLWTNVSGVVSSTEFDGINFNNNTGTGASYIPMFEGDFFIETRMLEIGSNSTNHLLLQFKTGTETWGVALAGSTGIFSSTGFHIVQNITNVFLTGSTNTLITTNKFGYIRITRIDDIFRIYYSPDNVTWNQVFTKNYSGLVENIKLSKYGQGWYNEYHVDYFRVLGTPSNDVNKTDRGWSEWEEVNLAENIDFDPTYNIDSILTSTNVRDALFELEDIASQPGIPTGGLEGQALIKNSDLDHDVTWGNVTGSTSSSVIVNRINEIITTVKDTFPIQYSIVNGKSYVDVWLNGIKLYPDDFTATDGQNVIINSPIDGTVNPYFIEIVAGYAVGAESIAVSVTRTVYTYISTQGQTVFECLYDDVNDLDVFLEGHRLSVNNFVAVDGTTVTLGVGLNSGDEVVIVAYKGISV